MCTMTKRKIHFIMHFSNFRKNSPEENNWKAYDFDWRTQKAIKSNASYVILVLNIPQQYYNLLHMRVLEVRL